MVKEGEEDVGLRIFSWGQIRGHTSSSLSCFSGWKTLRKLRGRAEPMPTHTIESARQKRGGP